MAICRICGAAETELMYRLAIADIRICRNCDTAFLDPMPTDEFLAKFYGNKEYFTTDYAVYFGQCLKGYSEESAAIRSFASLLNILPKPENGRLLDIGCSTGVFLDMARKRGWTVKGVEISEWASGYARDEFGLDVFTGTLEMAALSSASFDAVTAWDVLEHVSDPVSFLKEVNRILKPGGVFYVNTISHRSLLNLIAHVAYKMSFGLMKLPLDRLFVIQHLYYFSGASLKRILENAGFANVAIEMDEYPLERIDRVPAPVKAAMWVIYKAQEATGMKTIVTAMCVKPRLGGA